MATVLAQICFRLFSEMRIQLERNINDVLTIEETQTWSKNFGSLILQWREGERKGGGGNKYVHKFHFYENILKYVTCKHLPQSWFMNPIFFGPSSPHVHTLRSVTSKENVVGMLKEEEDDSDITRVRQRKHCI